MATPTQHSKLSASAGSKWVYCPPTLWMEEGLPDFTSEYAQEGTDAHRLAELKISLATKAITKRKYNVEVKQLAERSKFYDKDMEAYTDQHRDLVLEEYNSMQHAEIFTEQKVDATNIGFRAVKPDKTIIDVKRAGVSKDADGYWVFKIPKEFTQLASPAQKAHIYVQDKDNIYTSSDITFYIEPQFGENSGVSAESIEEIKRLLETAHALNIDLQRIQK